MTWFERDPSGDEDDWRMLGFLYLDDGRLAADVATETLANRLIAEVAARLGAAALLVTKRSSLPVQVHTREPRLLV